MLAKNSTLVSRFGLESISMSCDQQRCLPLLRRTQTITRWGQLWLGNDRCHIRECLNSGLLFCLYMLFVDSGQRPPSNAMQCNAMQREDDKYRTTLPPSAQLHKSRSRRMRRQRGLRLLLPCGDDGDMQTNYHTTRDQPRAHPVNTIFRLSSIVPAEEK